MTYTVRNAYSPPVRVSITFPEHGRTKQAGKDACDINQIMHRYIRQGVIEHVNQYQPQYLDTTGYDFQAAQELVANAQSMFADLPSQVRAAFKNDPAEFMDFVQKGETTVEALLKAAAPEPMPAKNDASTDNSVQASNKKQSGEAAGDNSSPAP